MKLKYSTAIAACVTALMLVGCSSSNETPAQTPQTSAAESETTVVLNVEMLDQADEPAYLEGFALRAPEGVEISDANAIRYGILACEKSNGYETGTDPNPTDQMVDNITDDGYSADQAEDIANAARNAKDNTLCSTEPVARN